MLCPRTLATRQEKQADIAEDTLSFFSETAERAQALLVENHIMGASTLAAVNTLTPGTAIQNLTGISEEIRRELRYLGAEPIGEFT